MDTQSVLFSLARRRQEHIIRHTADDHDRNIANRRRRWFQSGATTSRIACFRNTQSRPWALVLCSLSLSSLGLRAQDPFEPLNNIHIQRAGIPIAANRAQLSERHDLCSDGRSDQRDRRKGRPEAAFLPF